MLFRKMVVRVQSNYRPNQFVEKSTSFCLSSPSFAVSISPLGWLGCITSCITRSVLKCVGVNVTTGTAWRAASTNFNRGEQSLSTISSVTHVSLHGSVVALTFGIIASQDMKKQSEEPTWVRLVAWGACVVAAHECSCTRSAHSRMGKQ